MGLLATSLFEAATNRERFLGCVRTTLVPAPQPGGAVVMDDLFVHKVDGVRLSTEAAGARLLFLLHVVPTSNPSGTPVPR